MLSRAASVDQLADLQVTWARAAQALVRGFEEALGWEFEEHSLTPNELDRAAELERNRYANPDWTQRL